MEAQHNIKRKLTLPASITIIRNLAAEPGLDSRTQLAKRVCEEFSLYDSRGHVQTASCVKALRDLKQAGLVTLPAPTIHSGRKPGDHAVRRLRLRLTFPRRWRTFRIWGSFWCVPKSSG